MWLSRLILGILVVAAGACGNDGPVQSSAGRAARGMEWRAFHGIEYQVPAATRSSVQESVLPGPGGQGGIPTGVRPQLTLSLAGPHGFYLQIVRSATPTSLEGMKQVLVSNKIASDLVGTTTANGWELTYNQIGQDGAAQGKARISSAHIAGAYFQCTYGEMNCADPAAARAICRSLRPEKNSQDR